VSPFLIFSYASCLSKQIQVPVNEAKDFIDAYFDRYPGVKTFIDSTIERTREEGMVHTILGRYRGIPEINARNGALRQMAERTAVNTVIQGSAADLIKLAMIAIWKRIQEGSTARMLIQVHDELLFEMPENAIERETAMIEKEMTSCMTLDVPLVVQVKTGTNWAEA
ncbi:DNA polymerase, partial [Planctomycetota bacterium]